MRNNSHFARGSGVYDCRVCGHKTRSTGRGDNENVLLCADCFDLGGEENHLSDTGELYGSAENVLAMIRAIQARGANAEPWAELKKFAEASIAKA